MLQDYENLTLPMNFNKGMAQAKNQAEKLAFLLKALTQYERIEHYDENMHPSQVVVHPQEHTNPDYLLSWHTIRIPYVEGKTCTEYLMDMEHEHEHAQQRKGAGYTEKEKKMCDVSFSMYPTQLRDKSGHMTPAYAYNYTELRALQAEAQWIHSRYHGRMHNGPPCLVPEQKEILALLKNTYERIQGRPSKSAALEVNKKNARKAFWGKFNPEFAQGMSGPQVSRALRKGAPLIKQTMKELQALAKVLEKDIAELEKALSPEHERETKQAARERVEQYHERLRESLPEVAKAAGFDMVDKIPTGESYACIQCDSISLLEFYLRGFNKDLQYTPEVAGKLHIYTIDREGGQMTGGKFLIMMPKSLTEKAIQRELSAPIVQSTLANNGITYDDQINADAMFQDNDIR